MGKTLYHYHGNVKQFDSIVICNFQGQTLACSDKQALSNLAYQAKKILKLASNAKVILDSKFLIS